jgi:1-acyl-sn-glycerol-3-phosphate acyltransferase
MKKTDGLQYYHEEYPSFSRTEISSISFGWIFYGMLNYFWIKAILSSLVVFFIWLGLKIYYTIRPRRNDMTEEEKKIITYFINFMVSLLLLTLGIWTVEYDWTNEEKVIKVYRKYLGENYVPNNKRYTTIISNHISWADIMFFLSRECPSFIAKDSVKKIPFIGFISQTLQSLYIDRTSENSRHEIFEKIGNRQKEILEGKSLFHLGIYPEGTTSSGRSLMAFKKGAFHTLSPIKIYLFKVDTRPGNFPLGAGGMSIDLHVSLSCTFLKNNLTAFKLPVFDPNDYLFENFKNLGKDKSEIFTEASRLLMSEIGGLPLSNARYEDKLRYMGDLKRKVIKNT